MTLYKIVTLGAGGVGKSCLTIQFCRGYFVIEYDPTIESSFRKQVTIDQEAILLEIMDTAGQEAYDALRDHSILQGEGFILVYSIIDADTFDKLGKYYQSILRMKESENFPIAVFGNKADLFQQRAVSTQQGEEFAKEIDAFFFETSAKTNLNIQTGFLKLAKEMIAARKKAKGGEAKKKSGGCVIL